MNSDSDDSTYSDHSLELDPDFEIEIISHSLVKFSSELYLALKMRPNHSTNLVCSPVFVSNMMAALKSISEGATGSEIMNAVFPGVTDEEDNIIKDQILKLGAQAILETIKEDNSKFFSLKTSTGMFLQSRLLPKKDAVQNLKSFFKIDLEEFDFVQDDWKAFSEFVKDWALKSSSKKVGAVFNGPLGMDVDSHSFRMILINLVYFRGNWVRPFDPVKTENLPFYNDEKKSSQVPMMRSELLKNVLYASMPKLDCQAVVLPYKGERFCLVLFIPNERCGLSNIELRLESLSPKEYFKEMYLARSKMSQDVSIRVVLPRFTIDSTINFSTPLQELGVDALFQKNRCEFSNFAENSKEIYVNQVWQKVIFEVNEFGASRKTNSKFTSTIESPHKHQESSRPSRAQECEIMNPLALEASECESNHEIIEVIADHPFYFQVVDIKLDVLLLSGCCKNPLVRDSNQQHLQNLVRNSRRSEDNQIILSEEIPNPIQHNTHSNGENLRERKDKNSAKKKICDIEFDED